MRRGAGAGAIALAPPGDGRMLPGGAWKASVSDSLIATGPPPPPPPVPASSNDVLHPSVSVQVTTVVWHAGGGTIFTMAGWQAIARFVGSWQYELAMRAGNKRWQRGLANQHI